MDVLHADGRAAGVRTSTEHFSGGYVVIASGVRSPEIGGLFPADSGHAAKGPDPLADVPPAEFHTNDPVGACLYGAAPKWGACHWRDK